MSWLCDSNLSLEFQRAGVTGLVNPDLAAAGKFELGELSPTLVAHIRDLHLPRLQILERRRNVIAHEVEVVLIVLLGIMKCGFERRHGENQPAMAGVD